MSKLNTNPFRLRFLGAAETVTRSKYLLTNDKKNILEDCGLFQGYNLKLEKIAGNHNVLLKNPERISEEIFEIYTLIFKGIIWTYNNAYKKFSSKKYLKYEGFIMGNYYPL